MKRKHKANTLQDRIEHGEMMQIKHPIVKLANILQTTCPKPLKFRDAMLMAKNLLADRIVELVEKEEDDMVNLVFGEEKIQPIKRRNQ